MDATTCARHDALRRETRIGAVMNVVVGVLFFLALFGWTRLPIATVAIDFLPQTMGMTFLGGMVASLICLAKVQKGTLIPAGPVPTRIGQGVRVFALAVGATIVFGGAMAILVAMVGPRDLAPETALAMKSLYGFAMGFVTTPPTVRMALGMPFSPFARVEPAAEPGL